MSDYPSIPQLIPHREPMILIDELLDWSPGEALCRFTVREPARLVEDGRLEAPLLIEHMAQTVAVCMGYSAYQDGRGVRIGMIVGCRTFETSIAHLTVGQSVHIRATQRKASISASGFACEARLGSSTGDVIARATLTLYHGDSLNPELVGEVLTAGTV